MLWLEVECEEESGGRSEGSGQRASHGGLWTSEPGRILSRGRDPGVMRSDRQLRRSFWLQDQSIISERSENTGGVWEDFRLIWEVFAAVPGKGKGGLDGVVVVELKRAEGH